VETDGGQTENRISPGAPGLHVGGWDVSTACHCVRPRLR
jgi:hypothetical protein